jgi:hypothetical protein
MFQYAVGRSLAVRRDVPLALDIRPLMTDKLRSYALGGFRTVAPFADLATLPPSPGPIARRLRWLPKGLQSRRRVLETAFTFDASILDLTAPVHLSGNWQSERYFADVADRIRADFQLAGPFTQQRGKIAEAISHTNSVSVHVRRGDYVSNSTVNAYHGTCEPGWYEIAKAKLDQLVPDAQYIVFSDDADWSRNNLPSFYDSIFVEPSSDRRDEQDMHLMALCRHHIIANSSFSWWGAWLNPRSDKVVVAPRRWFRTEVHDTRDLIPAGWIRL